MANTQNSPWQVIYAAVQGVSHARHGLPCQDAVAYRVLPGNLLLAALADGAGTAERADLAARRAVAAALDSLEAGLEEDLPQDAEAWEILLLEALDSARQALEDLAQEGGEPLRSFATTLAFAVAGEAGLAIAQVGDGAVVIRDEDGSLVSASQQQRGEYANETYFLTGDQYREQAHIQFLPVRYDGLALLSDGLTRLALRLPAGEPHSPFFMPLFSFLEAQASNENGDKPDESALARFLSSDRVNARTDDDKSLILAVRFKLNGASNNPNGDETTLETKDSKEHKDEPIV